MAGQGEPLEGAIPPPSTYPNPMASNVNMHPMDAAYGVGHAWKGDDPIGPGLGNGTQPTHA
jgi:hypothetical protein